MAPVLARIRTVADWGREWEREAARSEARGEFASANKQAYLGQLIISPTQPLKQELLDILRRCHTRDRRDRLGFGTTPLTFCRGKLSGLYETSTLR